MRIECSACKKFVDTVDTVRAPNMNIPSELDIDDGTIICLECCAKFEEFFRSRRSDEIAEKGKNTPADGILTRLWRHHIDMCIQDRAYAIFSLVMLAICVHIIAQHLISLL